MNRLLGLVLAFSLTACVQNVALQTQFDPQEHAYAARPGSAVVSGQAFMRRRDGVVVYAAGSPVYLLPYTSYTQEIYEKASNPFAKISNPDRRIVDYTRVTQADGEGRFAVTGVPDGKYIVVTGVTWMAGDSTQGGDLTQLVEIKGQRSISTIITR